MFQKWFLVRIPVLSRHHRCKILTTMFRSLKNTYQKWQIKSPQQKWALVYANIDKFCRIIGIRIFSDMKNYWFTYSTALMLTIYFVLVIYTVQLLKAIRDLEGHGMYLWFGCCGDGNFFGARLFVQYYLCFSSRVWLCIGNVLMKTDSDWIAYSIMVANIFI